MPDYHLAEPQPPGPAYPGQPTPPLRQSRSPLDTLAEAAAYEHARPAPSHPHPHPVPPTPYFFSAHPTHSMHQPDGFSMLQHAAYLSSGGPMLPALANAAEIRETRYAPPYQPMPMFASTSRSLQAATHIPDQRPPSSGPTGNEPAPPSLAHMLSHGTPGRPPYALPEDSGVIRCICPFDDDDGFTIQCDRCNAWQHGMCVNVKVDNVPDCYHCHLCDPRQLDVGLATARQQRRRQDEADRRAVYDYDEDGLKQLRDEARERALTSDVDDLPYRPTNGLSHSLPASFRPDRTSPIASRAPSYSATTTPQSAPTHQKRRSVAVNDGGSATQPPAKRKRTTKPQATPEERPVSLRRAEPRAAAVNALSLAMQADELDDDTLEAQAAWQLEYTPVEECSWPSLAAAKQAAAAVMSIHPTWNVTTKTTILGDATFAKRSRRKGDPQAAPLDEPPPETSDDQDATHLTVPVIPFESPLLLPDGTPLNVSRFGSSATAALAPSSVAPFSGAMTGQQPSISCPYPRAYSYGVFAGALVPAGAFISEYLGEIIDLETYRQDPTSQYSVLGCTKPSVHAVAAPWNIVVDARRYGNETRFIRSSCHPNAVIRPIVVQHNKGVSSPLTITFGVFALSEIAKREEITLPWDWADEHLVHTLAGLLEQDSPSPQPKLSYWVDTVKMSERMASAVTTLLGLTTCACEKRKDCAIAWMYKLGSISRGTPKNNMTRSEAFEHCLAGAVQSVKAPAGTKRGKPPNLGPLVGLQRGWWPRSQRLLDLNQRVREEQAAAELEPEVEQIEEDAAEPVEPEVSMDVDESMIEAEDEIDKPVIDDLHEDSATDPMSASDEEVVVRRVKRRDSDQVDAMLVDTPIAASPRPTITVPAQPAVPALEQAVEAAVEKMAAIEASPPVVKDPTPPREPTPPPKPRAKISFSAYISRRAAQTSNTTEPPTPSTEPPTPLVQTNPTVPATPVVSEPGDVSRGSDMLMTSSPMALSAATSTSYFPSMPTPALPVEPALPSSPPPISDSRLSLQRPSIPSFAPTPPPPRPRELNESASSSPRVSPMMATSERFPPARSNVPEERKPIAFPPASTHFPSARDVFAGSSASVLPSLYSALSPSPEPPERKEAPLPPSPPRPIKQEVDIPVKVEVAPSPTIPTGPRRMLLEAQGSPPDSAPVVLPPTAPAATIPTAPASHFRRGPSPPTAPRQPTTPPTGPRGPAHTLTPSSRPSPFGPGAFKQSPRLRGEDEEEGLIRERSPPRGPRARLPSEVPIAAPTGPRNSFPPPLGRSRGTRSPSPTTPVNQWPARPPAGPRATREKDGASLQYRPFEGMPYGASTYRPGESTAAPTSARGAPPASANGGDRAPPREREREPLPPRLPERERERERTEVYRPREDDRRPTRPPANDGPARPYVDTASTYRPGPPPPQERYDRPPSWRAGGPGEHRSERDDRRDRDGNGPPQRGGFDPERGGRRGGARVRGRAIWR